MLIRSTMWHLSLMRSLPPPPSSSLVGSVPHTRNDALHSILKVKRVDRCVPFPGSVQGSLITDVGDVSTCQQNRGGQECWLCSLKDGEEGRERVDHEQMKRGKGVVQEGRHGEGQLPVLRPYWTWRTTSSHSLQPLSACLPFPLLYYTTVISTHPRTIWCFIPPNNSYVYWWMRN